MKKVILVVLAVVIMAIGSYGCAMLVDISGPATKLNISEGFTPKRTYKCNINKAWDRVMGTLRNQRIIVASSSKTEKMITTGYIEGWTVDVAALGTDIYRYQYQISFDKISVSSTRIDILCKVERKHMLKGGEAREAVEQLKAWEDDSHNSRKEAEKLEIWLYEQIEKSLNSKS